MGVKKFIKKSVAFVAAAAMALTMVVAPVGAGATYAEGTGSTTTDPYANLILDKKVDLKSNGKYKITLEAYARGNVEVTTTTSGVPCDIVLVLDQSGSMAYKFGNSNQTRQAALKEAAKNFINNVSENAMKDSNNLVDHKIALVTFGSSSSIISGNNTDSSAFVSVKNTAGRDSLLTDITNLPERPEGATAINEGMSTAKNIIHSNPIQNNQKRKRIVVVFTDGYPTTGSEFSKDVADSAIGTAKALKDNNTTVYTIGIFDGANTAKLYGSSSGSVGSSGETENRDECAENNAAANRFLNYMSSNFKTADSLGLKQEKKGYSGIFIDTSRFKYTITSDFNRDNNKYYMTASNREELNNIFETISNSVVSGGTAVPLDKTAVTRDIISDNFDLPSGYDKSKVTVKTADYKGNGSWDTAKLLSSATVNINGKTIDVSNFDYKTNYVAEATTQTAARGQKLIIEIDDIVANKGGMQLDTNKSESAVYANNEFVKAFPKPKVDIASTSYVLDYGKTVTTKASDYGVSAVTIANTNAPSPESINLQGKYGTFAINNGDLDYTPGKINWDGIDTGYVFGQKSDSKYKWEEVNFMPANSVYYEDDFASTATVEKGDTGTKIIYNEGKWTVDGTAQNSEKQSSNNEVQHGWDDSYKDDRNYSNGTAHKGTTGATATFKFTGTGVDIYSRTDLTTGKVLATLTKDGATAASKLMIVDNKAASGTYYQVPTLFFEGLDYGTYEVKIQVLNAIKEGESTRGTYYLDGIRVYNPLGVTTTEKVTNAYNVAGESNAIFTSVRKMLLDAKTFDGDTTTKGAVFIDQLDANNNNSSGEAKTATIGTYKKLGPKNEVYLDAGQAIAFKINTPYTGKVFIGAKSLNGQQVSMKVTDITTTEKTKTVTLSHTSDMYYQINPTTEKYVVIQNTNTEKGAILAITKLRLTGVPTATTQSSIDFESSPAVMSYVNEFAKLDSAKTDDRGMAMEKDKADVDIENPDNSKDDNNQETKPDQSHSNSIWNSIMNNLRKWFK